MANNKIIHKYLYFFFLTILCIPLAQGITGVVKIAPLTGSYELATLDSISIASWRNSSFQKSAEQYTNDRIGFRSFFVQVKNQLSYSFYNEANAQGVVKGKENYLYEQKYIDTYRGADFIGIAKIESKVGQFKQLQDSLIAKNKTLIVCLAPGKGSYYPEYFPDDSTKVSDGVTNYSHYATALKKKEVEHIDFNKWFLEMKDTCSCPLYPKYGIHWSHYGMLIASDSLINRVEQLRGIDMPNLVIDEMHRSVNLKHSDYDIAKGMNLLFQLPAESMCYPSYHFEKESTKKQPKALVVSDSFFWSMYNAGVLNKAFSPGQFWYYNKQIFIPDEEMYYVKDVSLSEALDESDVVILMSTEANLTHFDWGFVKNYLEQ